MKLINSKILLIGLLSLSIAGCDTLTWQNPFYENNDENGYKDDIGSAGVVSTPKKVKTDHIGQQRIQIHTDAGFESVSKSDFEKQQDDLYQEFPDVDNANTTANILTKKQYKLYKIKPGDTFWKIAKTQLGSGKRYPEIISLNPSVHKKSIKAGIWIKIPAE